MTAAGAETTALVAYGESRGRWILLATVLGSSLASIDGTVVSIALPAIGNDLDAGLQGLTWVVNAYSLALAALILLGGALGDRFGHRRVFVIGVTWFTLASVACAAAPNIEALVGARAVQGIGGALLTPGSLAILQSSFRVRDRGRAVGAWSGLAAMAGALAPLLGGGLLLVGSWRWIFLINVPVAAVVVIAARHVPMHRNTGAGHLDLPGTAFSALALASTTLGLGWWANRPLTAPSVTASLAAGAILLGAFVVWEARAAHPLLARALLASRLFVAVNAVTFAVYSALGGAFFWVVVQLQVVTGFTALQAGLALVPLTILVLLFSARASAWGQRVGPRLPMTLGPVVCAAAVAALARVDATSSYLIDVLPGVLVLGVGLVITVGPLTATALAAAPDRHAGVASAVNNTVARAGSLLAIAALPALTGLTHSYTDAAALAEAYRYALWICAGLLLVGALLAAVGIRNVDRDNEVSAAPPPEAAPAAAPPPPHD